MCRDFSGRDDRQQSPQRIAVLATAAVGPDFPQRKQVCKRLQVTSRLNAATEEGEEAAEADEPEAVGQQEPLRLDATLENVTGQFRDRPLLADGRIRYAGGAVSFDGRAFELFDLVNDSSETTDVAQEHPQLVAEMTTQLREWVDSVEQSRLGMDYASADSPESATTSAKACHFTWRS